MERAAEESAVRAQPQDVPTVANHICNDIMKHDLLLVRPLHGAWSSEHMLNTTTTGLTETNTSVSQIHSIMTSISKQTRETQGAYQKKKQQCDQSEGLLGIE